MHLYGGLLEPREWFRCNSLLKCVMQPKIAKNSLKTAYFWGSKSFKVIDVGTTGKLVSSMLVMIRSMSVSIYNHSRARLVDSSRNRTFSRRYPNLMRSYGLLEPWGSNLTALKSTFNAEHLIRRLCLSILNGFGAIHS